MIQKNKFCGLIMLWSILEIWFGFNFHLSVPPCSAFVALLIGVAIHLYESLSIVGGFIVAVSGFDDDVPLYYVYFEKVESVLSVWEAPDVSSLIYPAFALILIEVILLV